MSGVHENYFDYNATSPLLPDARAALVDALDVGFGNPSSLHAAGRASRRLVESARLEIAQLVGVTADCVTFVGGATEAIAQVLYTMRESVVVASSLEHPALTTAAEVFGNRKPTRVAVRLSAPPDGPIDAPALGADIAAATAGTSALVAVMAAHNVTGLLLPVDALHGVAGDSGRTLVDGAQAAGRVCLSSLVAAARPDYLILAAHKLGGPKGVGAIITPTGAPLDALFPGGGQEGGRRGGTEAVPLIASFGAAARYWRLHGEVERARLRGLRDHLEARLADARPDVRFIGASSPRLPQTSAIIVPAHLDGETVVQAMHRAGFAVSAGSACASGSMLPSPGLVSLGLSPNEAIRVVRVSLGHFTTQDSVDALSTALTAVFNRQR